MVTRRCERPVQTPTPTESPRRNRLENAKSSATGVAVLTLAASPLLYGLNLHCVRTQIDIHDFRRSRMLVVGPVAGIVLMLRPKYIALSDIELRKYWIVQNSFPRANRAHLYISVFR